jgi:cytochrome c biogenesis protein CcmG, thiol:disulfide interchange protein DsbE
VREIVPFRPAFAAILAAAVMVGCGADQPESAASPADYERALADAPPRLARLYSRPGELLDGGPEAFGRTLRSLRGHPVVVNKWASWCGPCRFEFPFFQKQAKKRGTEIAFLGVDGEDARDEARDFLKEFPVPYPSFFDPRSDIAERLGSEQNFPTTTFYDRGGKLVYTKPGGYASEAALEDDIREYAIAGAESGARQ